MPNTPFSLHTDVWLLIKRRLMQVANYTLLFLGSLAFLALIYDYGFTHTYKVARALDSFYTFCLTFFAIALGIRALLQLRTKEVKSPKGIDYILIVFVLASIYLRLFHPEWYDEYHPVWGYFNRGLFLKLPILSVFFIELSKHSLSLSRFDLNPALLFIASFALIIFIGTGLLLLPQASHVDLSVTDALFTATSAVCVTGLIVVDTATAFTPLGKGIILILIQIGAFGIMTFTSFFGYFFMGGSTFRNQLMLQDYVNDERIGHVFRTLFKIVIITLSIEFLGAFAIFLSLPPEEFLTLNDRVQFSVFHSISAFCNAGFSTLTDGLYDIKLRFNYPLHLFICFLIIMGGIGFPILFNFLKVITEYVRRKWRQFAFDEEYEYKPRIIHVNTRIVVITTIALLIFGTVTFYIVEYDNILAEHKTWYGKLVVAFFGSVTPRTAGFNVFNMGMMLPGTILIYLFLMWIGGSPASTGGGIKTSTFAIALINARSIGRGKEHLEVAKREIPNESVRRAFAVMLFSFLIIGTSIFLLTLFDPQRGLAEVAFECFSAYSTVGLSLNMTPLLSTPSKIVLILTMFAGRVGSITLLAAFISKVRSRRYRYPKENIFIN